MSRFHGARMTVAEYLALPEVKPYLEYVDGVVLQKPMADSKPRRLVGEFDLRFGLYAREHGGDFGPEGRVRLPDRENYRLPDTAFWVAGTPSGDDTLPTVAVEVRSKDQTMNELRAKCRSFRDEGVLICWLIDPVRRIAEVFEGTRDADPVPQDGVLETSHMLGFSLPLAELFAVLDR